jgi:hypothetical protein
MLVEANAALVEAAGRCAVAEKGAAEGEVERVRLSKQVAFKSFCYIFGLEA